MRERRIGPLLLSIAAGLGLGCQLEAPAFKCFGDADCLAGSCEVGAQLCSQPDAGCESMRRYTESAAELAGQCVPGLPDTTDPTNGTSPELGGACSDGDDCDDDGFCEPTGWCSYRDDTCGAGRRYGRSDDPSLEGECTESVTCTEVIDDKFQDSVLDMGTWFIRPGGADTEDWAVQANSRLNFRFPAGADGGGVAVAAVDTFDFSSGRIEVDVSRAPNNGLIMSVLFESTDLGTMEPPVEIELNEDGVVLWLGDFESANVDYAETPIIALQTDGANVTVEVSADGDDFEEVLSDRHDLDLSTARPVLSAWSGGGPALESDASVSFGSVEVCGVE